MAAWGPGEREESESALASAEPAAGAGAVAAVQESVTDVAVQVNEVGAGVVTMY